MAFPPRLRSRLIWLTEPSARRMSVLVGLLVALAFLSVFSAFRTRLLLTNVGGELSLTANGRTIRAPGRIARVDRIEIQTLDSVYPMGGETLRIEQGGRVVLEERLPDRFRVKRGRSAPLGDWFIDPSAGRGTVYERDLSLTGDFTLEVTFKGRCTEWTSVVLHGDSPAMIQFRRGLLNNDFALTVGGRLLALDPLISTSPQMALNALDILVRCVMLGCALVLVFALLRRLSAAHLHRFGTWKRHVVTVAVGATVLVALLLQLWVSREILERVAHTPDEVAYMVQAKWLTANRLYQPSPPIADHLAVPFTYYRDGKWFGMYPVGWPLLLAVGEALRAPEVVAPVLGALYVLVVFLIGKELYGKVAGLVAAVLAALSPMAILMFASYLSHGAAALLIALFLWLFLVARRRESLWLFGLAGASLGYAFAIRPMTAVAVAVPFLLLLLWELRRSGQSAARYRGHAALVVGGIVGALPALVANQLTTGSPFTFAYSYGAQASFSMQNLPAGLLYLDATAASVLPAIFGWGWGILSGWAILGLSLAFACVPFLIRRPGRFEVLLGMIFLALPLSFLTWGFHGLHGYGPRFYFEAFLAVYILTARGFLLLGGIESEREPVTFRWGAGPAVLSVTLLVLLTLSTAVTLPSRMRLYKGYNWVNGALESAIAQGGIRRALILFPDENWFSWGAASRLLPPDLRDDLVFAVSRPDNSKLAAFYGDRPAYTWNGVLAPATLPPGGPAPRTESPQPSIPGLTTLLGWWLAAAVAITAAVLGIARLAAGWNWRILRTRLPGPVSSGVPPPSEPSPPEPSRPPGPAPPALSRGRALSAIAAVLIAYAGQSLLVSGPLAQWLARTGIAPARHFHLGWLLLVAGAIVFAVAWRRLDPDRSDSPRTADREPGDGNLDAAPAANEPNRLSRALGAAAVVLSVLNVSDWSRHGETLRTRIVWGLSVVLLISALAALRERGHLPSRPGDLPRLAASLLLVLIAGVAFFLRFVGLTEVPLDVHGDFTSIGLGASDILHGRVPGLFATGWAGLPTAAYLPSALTMRLFGETLFGMNMSAVLAGTAAVVGIYCLASLLFSRSIGLLAAAVSAVGYTDIHFSRVSAYMDPVPWMVFGIYFLVRGLRSGRLLDFGLSGALLAVGFEMYFSGRLVVLVLIAFLAYLGLLHRATLRSRWKGLLILVLAGVVVTGPMLVYHWRHFDAFMSRTREVDMFAPENMKHLKNKYGVRSVSEVLGEQAWRSLLTFNYTPDSSTQFGFRHPMLNPALAPLFVLGAALGAARLRRQSYALLGLWLGLGVLVGSILTIDSPFWPRLVVLLPAVAILTAVGIFAAFRSLVALLPGRFPPWLALVPGLGMVALIGHQNWRWYFHGGPRTHVAPIAWVSRLIEKTPAGTSFCMVRDPLDFADRVPRFLVRRHSIRDFPASEFESRKLECHAEGRAWVIVPPLHDWVLASLNRSFPGGREERHNYPEHETGPIFWYPPADATGGRRTP